jgi:hypothetical protein
MAVRIQLRRDTAANWVSSNPTLRAGEIGIETDTLKFKIGNGSSPWNSITAYANVVPSDLNNSLNGYVEVADIGAANGVVGLNGDQDAVIPGMAIIFEGETDDIYETILEVEDPTADNVVTIPDATTTLVGTDTTDTLTNKTLTSPVVSGLTLSDASIIFEGAVADSYETTLTVGEPTDDRTLTLPDATDTLVGRNTTDTLTNKTLTSPTVSGLYLSDSSIVFEGTANDHETTLTVTDPTADRTLTLPDATGTVALTSDITTAINALSTTDIEEGTNKYFTDELAVDAVAAAIAAGSHTNITISYDDNANSISFTGAVTYTDENAQDAVGNAVGNGLDYDDNTGAISVDPSEFALNAVGAPTGNVDLASYKITNLAAPTSANDAANKAYVDNTTAGLNFHVAAHCASTANLTATYDNGTGGVGATLTNSGTNEAFQLDNHVLEVAERVLIKDQTDQTQNGIYVVTTVGDGSTPWVLTRATDADNSPSGEVSYGDFIFIQQGTHGGSGYILTTTGTVTIGTTNLVYTQFNAGQTVIAGNGLTETTPGTLAINTAVTVDLNTAQTLTNKTITGTFTGNLTGNADTVTNGVVTTGSYADPAWITSLSKSKVGLGNVENTALSTWAGSTNLTTLGTITTGTWTGTAIAIANGGTGATDAGTARTNLGLAIGTDVQAYNSTLAAVAGGTYTGDDSIATVGTVTAGTWNGTEIGPVYGGTGLTSYATGDIIYASSSNTLSKLAAGTDGYLLTLSSGVPTWAAAPISLPSQTGNAGKYLTTDGTTASWGTLVVPIETDTATLTANTATTISTTALSVFTSIEYMVSLKQGSKVRTSKVVMQTDGTSVDMTEFAITETGGTMSGVVISATTSGSDAVLQATVTDASSTNVDVKFSKVKL